MAASSIPSMVALRLDVLTYLFLDSGRAIAGLDRRPVGEQKNKRVDRGQTGGDRKEDHSDRPDALRNPERRLQRRVGNRPEPKRRLQFTPSMPRHEGGEPGHGDLRKNMKNVPHHDRKETKE